MQKHVQLVLLWLCVSSIWPQILGLRASKPLEEVNDRDDLLLGTRNFSAGCIDIRLLLSGPTHEFTALVSHSQGSPDADECLLTAAIHSDDGESQCDSHVWDVRGPQAQGVSYTQPLRLESSCSVGDMSLKVLRNHAATKRRLLADNTSPAANLTSVNQTVPISPSPASTNSQGPSSGIACCCGQNNQVGSSSQCCCGPISICCQSSGFCMTQNCTAIFVGSTLIAGALISFMTCGICIYRARSSLQDPALWARSGGRLRDQNSRRVRRPLPVQAPPLEGEGTPRECPVCLEEITSNSQWVIFHCRHATCRTCFDQLVAKPHQDAACPLCRSLLTELVPEEAAPQVSVQMQPLQREPAAQHAPLPAASMASTSRGPVIGSSQ
ncbi:g6244 [Coccomyxa elongata]